MGGAFKCPGCGETTWGALNHCPKCGESLTRKCPGCGGTWRYIYADDYQFCPSCGTRVEPVKLERKGRGHATRHHSRHPGDQPGRHPGTGPG